MEKTSFGERLRQAFGGAKQVEIARKMGVSESAVKNYVTGRVPDAEKLLLIKNLTNCDLDWLLTGEGSQFGTTAHADLKPNNIILTERLQAIAAEQSHRIFAEAELGGTSFEARTLELLVEFLIARGMESLNLVEKASDVMTRDRYKRASKFEFVAAAPSALELYIREVVRESLTRPGMAGAPGELRDIIREIVQEEVKSPLYTLDVGDQQKTRKAG